MDKEKEIAKLKESMPYMNATQKQSANALIQRIRTGEMDKYIE